MNTVSIKRNYFFNTANQVLTMLVPLITAPYISRVLGADCIGIYSYTNSVVSIFSLFAVLGTTSYAQRVVAQSRDDRKKLSKNFHEIASVCILTTTICTCAWLIYAFFIEPKYKIYYLVLTFHLLSEGLNISWLYFGLEKFSIIVFRSVAVKITSVICLFLFVKSQDDLILYIAIMAVSQFVGNMSIWLSKNKYVDRVPLKELKIASHLKSIIAYFIPMIASSVYMYLDKVMIGLITKSDSENGFYEQSQKIVNLAYSIVASLNIVMSSRMSYLFSKDDKEAIQEKLELSLNFVITLSVPMCFGLIGIAHNFVPWFFGPGYEDVINLLILRSPLVIILGLINYYADQYLLPSGQRVRSTKGVILGATVNFVLNLILINLLQASGAVIATLVGEIVICLCYGYMSKEYVSVKWFIKYLPSRLIGGLIVFLVVFLVGINHSGSIFITVLQVALGGLVYFAYLIIIKDPTFCNFLKSIFKKNKV